MKKTNKILPHLLEHLDSEHGKTGTEMREKYEEGFEAIKLSIQHSTK